MLTKYDRARKDEGLEICFQWLPIAKLQMNLCNGKEQFLFFPFVCMGERGRRRFLIVFCSL